MKNIEESSDDDEYNEISYDDEFSNETSDEIDEQNELIIDGIDGSEDSDSDNSEIDVVTLKTTMIFPKKGQNISKIPQVIPMPQLKGILLPKPKIVNNPILPKKDIKKYDAEEIEMILQKMPGINVSSNTISYDRQELYDLLQKESQESVNDFNIRKDITLKIYKIEEPKIRNSTCIVIGLMIAKKLRFGIKYENDIELLIKTILDILKSQ